VHVDPALPPSLPQSDLFARMSGDALKLYLWLRARARVESPSPSSAPSSAPTDIAYLEAEATSAEIERAVDVSKNTVTKLARELQTLGLVTFQGGRTGYRFRVGETLSRSCEPEGVVLSAAVFYLDARLAAETGEGSRGG
jgi:hypothetical protein